MNEGELEYLRQSIDERVGVWLTAHGVSDEIQMDLDYSDYDDAVERLVEQARERERLDRR